MVSSFLDDAARQVADGGPARVVPPSLTTTPAHEPSSDPGRESASKAMKRLRRIVAVTTPGLLTDVVLRDAAELARMHEARLSLLDIIEPVPQRTRITDIDGRRVDHEEALVRDRHRLLRHLVDEAAMEDVDVFVAAGAPCGEATRHIAERGCDLLVLGLPPGDKGGKRLPPDVRRLLRSCPAPLWIMRSPRPGEHKVMALVDPDRSDLTRAGLDQSVLDAATSAARLEHGELHVAHAWELRGEPLLRSSAFVSLPQREVDAMVVATREAHRRRLEDIAQQHGVDEIGGTLHLVRGAPARVLPDLAERLGITLVVAGTMSRTGLSGWVMGNTAETLVAALRCSVLILKPPQSGRLGARERTERQSRLRKQV